MSLDSTRGRFSLDKSNINIKKYVSYISRFGSVPFFYKEKNNDDKNESKNFKVKLNLNPVKLKKKYDDEDFDIKPRKNNKKKKGGKLKIIAAVVVEIITLSIIFTVGSAIRISKKAQDVSYDEEYVRNTNITKGKLEVLKGYQTIAIFGLDSRSGNVGKGSNSDVIMIVNINRDNGEVQLMSVYRDTFLNISDNNSYGKINAAYSKGGPERAIKAINKNFDLDIKNYFTFNWRAVAIGIEAVGGVDIDVTEAEFKYLNPYIWDTGRHLGIADEYIRYFLVPSAGPNHLNGIQAVAYARIRFSDNDFRRTERQKEVVMQCFEKAKRLDVGQLKGLADRVLPEVAYNYNFTELMSLIRTLGSFKIVTSTGVPEVNNMVMEMMGKYGSCVVPNTLVTVVKKIHNVLYGDEDYTPSSAVQTYSRKITELRHQYEEEAKNAATVAVEDEETEKTVNVNTNTTTRRSTQNVNRSTRSTATNNTNINDESNTVNDAVPIEESEEVVETKEGITVSTNAPYNTKPTTNNSSTNSANSGRSSQTNNTRPGNSTSANVGGPSTTGGIENLFPTEPTGNDYSNNTVGGVVVPNINATNTPNASNTVSSNTVPAPSNSVPSIVNNDIGTVTSIGVAPGG